MAISIVSTFIVLNARQLRVFSIKVNYNYFKLNHYDQHYRLMERPRAHSSRSLCLLKLNRTVNICHDEIIRSTNQLFVLRVYVSRIKKMCTWYSRASAI